MVRDMNIHIKIRRGIYTQYILPFLIFTTFAINFKLSLKYSSGYKLLGLFFHKVRSSFIWITFKPYMKRRFRGFC